MFLGKVEGEVVLQLVVTEDTQGGVAKKVLALSDSRDSTLHWSVADSGLVGLIKRNLQPVIRIDRSHAEKKNFLLLFKS